MDDGRDYRNFLNETGRLNVRLLPRDVYTALVNEYRRRDSVIDEVFEQLYLTWDLEQNLAAQDETAEGASKAEAAQVVLDSLEDSDWWRVMEAFENALIRDFSDHASSWANLLDPVYDDQEEQGWCERTP